MASV
ncbi:hypothetical protein YPPY94_3477, partial [Yersinia pestis PY-94]|jgi:hypothetical protein